MTRHDDLTRLRHTLGHASEAVQLTEGRRRADLDAGRLFALAMTRLLEIIGEAAARMTQTTRDQNAQIPWSAIAGMRNCLIHGYDAVDYDVLWDVVHRDLPALIPELEKIVQRLSGGLGAP